MSEGVVRPSLPTAMGQPSGVERELSPINAPISVSSSLMPRSYKINVRHALVAVSTLWNVLVWRL
ncbi:hypothetical protein V1291_003935 [Nitrobacteraceae bacterium AZCC 1564]